MPDYTLHTGYQSNAQKFIQAEHGYTLIDKLPAVEHLPTPSMPTGIVHNNSEQYNQLPEGLQIEPFRGEQRRPNLHRVNPHGSAQNTKSTSSRQAVNSGIAGRVF